MVFVLRLFKAPGDSWLIVLSALSVELGIDYRFVIRSLF
jgi:hypothetical protein